MWDDVEMHDTDHDVITVPTDYTDEQITERIKAMLEFEPHN